MSISTLRVLALAVGLSLAFGQPASAQVGKNVEAPAVSEAATYLNSPALRTRALAALTKRLGTMPPVSRLEITGDRIILWTQSREAAHYTDSWTASRMKLLV